MMDSLQVIYNHKILSYKCEITIDICKLVHLPSIFMLTHVLTQFIALSLVPSHFSRQVPQQKLCLSGPAGAVH